MRCMGRCELIDRAPRFASLVAPGFDRVHGVLGVPSLRDRDDFHALFRP
jgi:hypothetical protein